MYVVKYNIHSHRFLLQNIKKLFIILMEWDFAIFFIFKEFVVATT